MAAGAARREAEALIRGALSVHPGGLLGAGEVSVRGRRNDGVAEGDHAPGCAPGRADRSGARSGPIDSSGAEPVSSNISQRRRRAVYKERIRISPLKPVPVLSAVGISRGTAVTTHRYCAAPIVEVSIVELSVQFPEIYLRALTSHRDKNKTGGAIYPASRSGFADHCRALRLGPCGRFLCAGGPGLSSGRPGAPRDRGGSTRS